MTAPDLARQVQKMRAAQKRYSRERQPSALNESRDWERRVDRLCEEILAAPDLFAEKSSDPKS